MLLSLLRPWIQREDGQGLVEYALIIALVALLAIAALVVLGTAVSDILQEIGDCLGEPSAC
jgi:pilus assembly protein Flp/PilA